MLNFDIFFDLLLWRWRSSDGAGVLSGGGLRGSGSGAGVRGGGGAHGSRKKERVR